MVLWSRHGRPRLCLVDPLPWWIPSLLLIGGVLALLATLVIMQAQPKVQRKSSDGSILPLDVYFLIDASDSMSERSWHRALGFAGKLALALERKLPHFRAAIGQFASTANLIHPLSGNLSAFRHPSRGVTRIWGRTNVSVGLCGDNLLLPLLSCPGGAYGELVKARPQAPDVGYTQRIIVLVTDGVPFMPELTVQAVKFIKESKMELLGILVTKETRRDWIDFDTEELYAMSSCCPSPQTVLRTTRKWNTLRVGCAAEINMSCPKLITETSFKALSRSVDFHVRHLHREMFFITAVEEAGLSQELKLPGSQPKSSDWHALTDWHTIWFLALLVPFMVYVCWQDIIRCCPASQRPSQPAVVEPSFATVVPVSESELMASRGHSYDPLVHSR